MKQVRVELREFFEDFEAKFIDYFLTLSYSYDKTLEENLLRRVAKLVYEQIQNSELDITQEEEELFYQMRKDGIMVGFLINRAMFFFLENFIDYTQNNKPETCHYIQKIILSMTHFIKHCETHVCDKYKVQMVHLNFDANDNMIIGNNIIDVFKQLYKNKKKAKFFNLYKGVPISYEAAIISIDGEEITFKTEAIQEIAMKMDGTAYILKDENFDKHIKADIVYNNFFNNTVVLSNFTYLLNMPASQREYVRVHPDILAYVNIANNKTTYTKGKLYDLSVKGLGVVSGDNNGLYAGAKIDMSFELIYANDERYVVETVGEILNIIEYSDSYRYCIKIFPGLEQEDKIVAYVRNREKEIVKNLEDILQEYI